jgi:hypothetical protein
MKKLKKCHICNNSDNLTKDTYEDWDDEKNIEIIRDGFKCNNCGTFQYEENNRIICVMETSNATDFKETNVGSYLINVVDTLQKNSKNSIGCYNYLIYNILY